MPWTSSEHLMYVQFKSCLQGDGLISETVVSGSFVKKVFLKILQNVTEKQLCRSLFFNKVEDLRPAILLKKDFNIVVFQ